MKEKLSSKDWGPFKKVHSFMDNYGTIDNGPKFGETGSLIVRQMGVKEAGKYLGISSKDPVEVAKRAKGLFDRLKNDYDIPVAVHVVLSDTEKEPIISLLADKIEGYSMRIDYESDDKGNVLPSDENNVLLNEISDREKADLAIELDNVLSSLAKYLLDNHKRHDFLWDIGSSRQYMWGRRFGEDGVMESKSHIYLIDIDIITNINKDKIYRNVYFDGLKGFVKYYQRRLNTNFTKTEEAMKRISDGGIMSEPSY